MEITGKGFGPFDIRGIYPEDVNEELMYRVGRIFPRFTGASRVAVGHDIRLTGPGLAASLMRGLTEAGCDVMDIGQCGTEMIYFATAHYGLGGGLMVTASHNPKQYNGLKLVREGSRPLSVDDGLPDIKRLAVANDLGEKAAQPGKIEQKDIMGDYIAHLLSYIDLAAVKPYKVVMNAGNGAAGPVVDALEKHLPLDIVKVFCEPDGNFPNGVPNPLLQENRAATVRAVRENGADFGVAWDGDFDRCFMVDEHGNFIEGYYMVGFLAEAFLAKHPGAAVVYDPRLTWNTVETCEKLGGRPVLCKSGHAFIKAKMREEDAIYGGEMSAHHYFRDFSYCDSGMIPWLLVWELLSKSGKPLSALMQERMERYPVSGEINSKVADADAVLRRIEAKYGEGGKVTHVDGVSVEYDAWRFNLRKSNTEPVIRLNVETRGDAALLKEKTEELLKEIRS